MRKGRHKKLYYVPGLISLVVVPLLFTYFGKQKYKELNKAVIELNLNYNLLSDTIPITYPTDRAYEEIALSTDNQENIVKLAYVKQQLAEMVAKNDSTGGIHISFNDAKYHAYVDAINMLYGMENVAKVVSEDGIRYFNLLRPKNNFWICGGVIFQNDSFPEPSFFEKLKMLPENFDKKLKLYLPALKGLWLVLVSFSILIILSVARCFKAGKTSI